MPQKFGQEENVFKGQKSKIFMTFLKKNCYIYSKGKRVKTHKR